MPNVFRLELTLGDQPIEIGEVWTLNSEVTAADIVDGFVVNHETTVRVFESSVGGEDRVVRLHDRRRNLFGGVNTELELALLAVVNREAFHQQSTEPRTSTTAERVENKETL